MPTATSRLETHAGHYTESRSASRTSSIRRAFEQLTAALPSSRISFRRQMVTSSCEKRTRVESSSERPTRLSLVWDLKHLIACSARRVTPTTSRRPAAEARVAERSQWLAEWYRSLTAATSRASLRNPANFCNIVGLRPSPGRVANERDWFTLSVAGPVARNVKDCAFFLSILAGFDRACPIGIDQSGFRVRRASRTELQGCARGDVQRSRTSVGAGRPRRDSRTTERL